MLKPKTHSQAFWDALARRSVTPEQLVPHLPDFCEFEIAAEMVKARQRLDEEAHELERRRQIFAEGKPRHLRDRHLFCIPARR